jgi:hypothetical protein
MIIDAMREVLRVPQCANQLIAHIRACNAKSRLKTWTGALKPRVQLLNGEEPIR